MGLALPPKYGADGLVWAQHWLQNMLPIILYGPSTGPKLCYRWSYMGPLLVPHVLPMVLHGPSTGPKIFYRWHCMGPALVTKYTANHLVWAQSWPQPIVLHGPSTGPNICCLKLCMVPTLAAEGLVWAPHWSQNMVPMALYGSSIGFKMCHQSSCMGPALAPNSATDGLIWAHPGPICAAS